MIQLNIQFEKVSLIKQNFCKAFSHNVETHGRASLLITESNAFTPVRKYSDIK